MSIATLSAVGLPANSVSVGRRVLSEGLVSKEIFGVSVTPVLVASNGRLFSVDASKGAGKEPGPGFVLDCLARVGGPPSAAVFAGSEGTASLVVVVDTGEAVGSGGRVDVRVAVGDLASVGSA